jgi:hypothetical protein
VNTNEKLMALRAIDYHAGVSLCNDGKTWHLVGYLEIAKDGMLQDLSGFAASPEACINTAWDEIEKECAHGNHVRSRDGKRWRWRGYMWEPVVLEGKTA